MEEAQRKQINNITTKQSSVELFGAELQDNQAVFRITDNRRDADGEAVDIATVDLSYFMEHGKLTLYHSQDMFPIGKPINTIIRNNAVYVLFEFHNYTQDAETALKLVKGGFLTTGSIEMNRTVDTPIRVTEQEGEPTAILDNMRITAFSLVINPANQRAVNIKSFPQEEKTPKQKKEYNFNKLRDIARS